MPGNDIEWRMILFRHMQLPIELGHNLPLTLIIFETRDRSLEVPRIRQSITPNRSQLRQLEMIRIDLQNIPPAAPIR